MTDGVVKQTGQAFNDAHPYVDWLLTVPLLLIEPILVMRLPRQEYGPEKREARPTGRADGHRYPGEVASDAGTRWLWWALAMVPFVIIVYDLFVGLRELIATQPEQAGGLVSTARWLTVGSRCFYPIVFVLPMLGLSGGSASTAVQVGYTIADIVAKAVFGLYIYLIAVRKSEAEASRAPVGGQAAGLA